MDGSKFTIIPNEVMADHRLTLIEMRVLIALFSFRGKNTNLVWPSRIQIGERCGYAGGTISNATKSLIKKGWLRKSKQVFNGPNTFEITVPEVHRSGEVHRISEVHRSGEHEVHRSGEECVHRSGEPNKPVSNQGTNQPDIPPGLDVNAWEQWVAYRKQIRKPLKPASIPAAQRKLAAMGADQARAVEESIANGWQGVFPPKSQQSVSRGTSVDQRRDQLHQNIRELCGDD